MPDGYAVEAADGRDAAACAAIGAQCFSESWSEDALRRAAEDGSIFLVARLRGRTVGYFLALQTLDEGQIVAVAVAEEHRRKGVGGRLLRAAICEGARRGVAVFYLEVRSGNHAAVSLYEQAGFLRDGIRRGFYSRTREDAVLMSLKLREISNEDTGN